MTKILDGGLSTELENLGATFDGPLWTGKTLLENPVLIEHAHRNYVESGAEVIITSSYQLSRQGFQEIGLTSDDADRALVASVEVAKKAAAGTNTKVAASIGPFGAVLHDGSEYRGNYGRSEDELFEFHKTRIEILESAGPDVLLAETIPDLTEVKALARAFEQSKLPVWVSFSAGSATELWSGEKIVDAVLALRGVPTLEAIGFNCVNPELVSDLVATVRSVSNVPLVAYPNKGGKWDAETGQWNYQTGKVLVDYWPEWQQLDLEFVGGCCGTDARDIRKLTQAVSDGNA